MRNYEIILLLAFGFTPQEIIRDLRYSRSSTYRFNRIFREARKRIKDLHLVRYNGSPAKKRKLNPLDALRAKKMRAAKREIYSGKVEVWIDPEA